MAPPRSKAPSKSAAATKPAAAAAAAPRSRKTATPSATAVDVKERKKQPATTTPVSTTKKSSKQASKAPIAGAGAGAGAGVGAGATGKVNFEEVANGFKPAIVKTLEKWLPRKFGKKEADMVFGKQSYEQDYVALNKGLSEPAWELLDRGMCCCRYD